MNNTTVYLPCLRELIHVLLNLFLCNVMADVGMTHIIYPQCTTILVSSSMKSNKIFQTLSFEKTKKFSKISTKNLIKLVTSMFTNSE